RGRRHPTSKRDWSPDVCSSDPKADRHSRTPLAGPRSVAVIFDKTSTRTRMSFDVGITELGGHAMIMDAAATQIGKGETIEDTAKEIGKHTSELQSRFDIVCRLLLEKKKKNIK